MSIQNLSYAKRGSRKSGRLLTLAKNLLDTFGGALAASQAPDARYQIFFRML
ncbi:MAG: hypothetical protein AAFO63_02375 [Pseudomonadota bacterium]